MLSDEQIEYLNNMVGSLAFTPEEDKALSTALSEIAALRATVVSLTAERDDQRRMWTDRDAREVEAGKRCGVDRDAFGVDWPEHVAAKLVSVTAERDRLAVLVAKMAHAAEAARAKGGA